MQCVTVCCSTLQYIAVRVVASCDLYRYVFACTDKPISSVLQYVAVRWSMLQWVVVSCYLYRYVFVCTNIRICKCTRQYQPYYIYSCDLNRDIIVAPPNTYSHYLYMDTNAFAATYVHPCTQGHNNFIVYRFELSTWKPYILFAETWLSAPT